MSVAWVAVGATLVGGVASANAAGKAADAQAEGANNANDTQRYMYDTTRADNAPFLANGTAASNRLAYLMGLSPAPSGTATGGNALAVAPTRESLRAQLLGQYTTAGTGGQWVGGGENEGAGNGSYSPVTPGTVNEAGLSAEIERRMAEHAQQAAATAGQQASNANDPEFGSLMRDFSMADFEADPGAAFRLQQGEQALARSASARGGLYSGRALKDLTTYAQGQASQEYGNAFNRFQVNRTNKLNPLQSMMGAGQTAASQVGSAGQNMANNISANQVGVGNARASGYIAQGNALQNGINGGVSAWRNNYNTPSTGGTALYPDWGAASGPSGAWV